MRNIVLSLFILAYNFVLAQTTLPEYPVFKHADAIDKQVIPADTSVRTGTLDNGLTYYVQRCNNPKQRAFFQLLVKAGSVLENDNERGIAHFTEHMMFKGTKHFPKQNVIGFMHRNGIQFGHDSNAFTGFNTVRYMLNSIPMDNEQLMDSCLLLLRDWAGNATISKEDVESEHNVIVEEWRSKQIISFAQQMQDDLLENSVYANRLPIGDMNIVQNCSANLVRNFYKRWYQPQNQAVIVVGDFDADSMVVQVKKMFGDMKRGKDIAPAQPVMPTSDTLKVSVYQEKIIPYALNALMIRDTSPVEPPLNTIGGQRNLMLRNKVKDIVEEKLKTLKAHHKELYDAEMQSMNLADIANTKILLFGFGSSTDNWKEAYELLAKLLENIRRNGFKDEDWKEKWHTYAAKYNEDSTAIVFPDTIAKYKDVQSSKYIDRFCANFFTKAPILADGAKNIAENHIKNTFNTKQLNEAFLDVFGGKNMVIAPILPEGATKPSDEELLAIFDRVKNMSDEELADIDVEKARKLDKLSVDSLDFSTIPGTVKKTVVLNDSISEAYLSNGVKVVFWKKKTDRDELNFMLRRPSGYSVLKDDEIHFHDMLSSCVRHYEFWNGSGTVNVQPFDDVLDHCVHDRTYLESLMKFFYASLTSTEVDSVEFAERLETLRNSTIEAGNPVIQSQFRITSLPVASIGRITPPTTEEFSTYTIERFSEVVKEYYSNYNGSTLIVQGEVNTDSIMPLILKYIGALPSKATPVKRIAWPADHYKTTNSTLVEKIENPTPFCITMMYYTWEKGYKYTQETHAHNEVLKSILGNLLLNTLRVQHSDVYTPSCIINDDLLPVNRMKLTVTYTCNPTQRERIAADVQQLIHDMAEGDLINQTLIDNCIKQREKQAESSKPNDYSLRRDYLIQEQDGIVINSADVSHIKKVTPASLKTHLKQLLKQGNLHIGYLTTE